MKSLLILFLMTSAYAQLPNAPQPKVHQTFFDTQNVTMFWADASAIGAEVGTVCSNTTTSSIDCRNIAVGASGFIAAEVLGSAILHKTGHHSLERLAPPAALLFHVGRLIYVATNRK